MQHTSTHNNNNHTHNNNYRACTITMLIFFEKVSTPGINNNKALHTIAVYTKDFTGSFKVQGSMASSPTSAEDFFDITMDGAGSATNTFSSSTTVTMFNFLGVYQNVRFTWDNDPDNTGIVDKILYRQ